MGSGREQQFHKWRIFLPRAKMAGQARKWRAG